MKRTSADSPSSSSDGQCSLSNLSAGEHATVVKLTAGKEALRRMVSLGFTPGTEIAMVQNPRYGPLIVVLRDIRIAIGRGEAQKVQVRRSE